MTHPILHLMMKNEFGFLKSKNKPRMSTFTMSIQYFTGGSSQSNMMKEKTKKIKRYKDWKRRNLTAIICIAIIAYIKTGKKLYVS